MATFTASAAQANVPAVMHLNGVIARVVEHACTVAASAGDVYQMVRVPNGALVTRVVVANSASAGVITVNVGDGNDTSAYAAAVVLSGSTVLATSMPYRGIGRSYSAEDTIDLVVTAISSPAAETKLRLLVEYTLQNGA